MHANGLVTVFIGAGVFVNHEEEEAEDRKSVV